MKTNKVKNYVLNRRQIIPLVLVVLVLAAAVTYVFVALRPKADSTDRTATVVLVELSEKAGGDHNTRPLKGATVLLTDSTQGDKVSVGAKTNGVGRAVIYLEDKGNYPRYKLRVLDKNGKDREASYGYLSSALNEHDKVDPKGLNSFQPGVTTTFSIIVESN